MLQTWLALATLCFLVLAGPQTAEAAPTLVSYVFVNHGGSGDYFELTFSEPVTYGNTPGLLTINMYYSYTSIDNFGVSHTITGTPSQQLTSGSTISPPMGTYSKYLTIVLGSAEYGAIHAADTTFTAITVAANFVYSPDHFGNVAYPQTGTPYVYSAASATAPTLTEFDYDVSLGLISLTFSANVRFVTFAPSALNLTNNNSISLPVVPSSYSWTSPSPYTTVQIYLPVQTAVVIATSPWIGANISLLYLTFPAAAGLTDYWGTPVTPALLVTPTAFKRDCYNLSTYFNTTIRDCQPCDPGCLTCAGPLPFPDSVSGCTNCSVVIMNGPSYQCVRGTSCPDGYYLSSVNTSPITTPGSILCLPCNSSCFTCTNGTQCTSCVGLLPATPTQCCANMTGGPTCMACNDRCNGGCRGPLNTDCVYCRELNYTLNGTTYCLSSCPPHTYQEEGLCLKCTSNVSEVLCPPYACWLGFGYNRDTYVCELTQQFRFIVIPATCGGGGLLVITCLIICALCWHLPNASPSSRDKHAYVNPAYKPESKSSENPLLK